MIKRLSQKGLVKSDPYSNVFLTTKGLSLAKRTTHNYRVIEVFLKSTLGYNSPDKLRQEAHKLEHAFSDSLKNKLSNFSIDNNFRKSWGKTLKSKLKIT